MIFFLNNQEHDAVEKIPANFHRKKPYTMNCPCLFSQQLLKKNQISALTGRRLSTFNGKDGAALLMQNIEAGYKG